MAFVERPSHLSADLSKYADAVNLLRQQGQYAKYVNWHHGAVNRAIPPNHETRNVAHRGPAFFPWHREFIWRFERDLQMVLGDPKFGLPYWDWSADRTSAVLASSRVFSFLGANAGAVVINGVAWRRYEVTVSGNTPRITESDQVRRDYDAGVESSVPSSAQVIAFTESRVTYDAPAWDFESSWASSLRNECERRYHDTQHVLVGGDMGRPHISVNDPLFFMHHAMVDRIWAHWQENMLLGAQVTLDQQYVPRNPPASGIVEPNTEAAATLAGHRLSDPMWPWNDAVAMSPWGMQTETITPHSVLDHRDARLNYIYDTQRSGCLTVGAVFVERVIEWLKSKFVTASAKTS